MTSDEIRERFLTFFAERDHKRLPSGSLIPASYDPSVLLTTAGMHPLKDYFAGRATPPHHRLTSCQKCFRTPDIEVVGTTTRHLTFFEMLGNFSLGDYFKEGAVELAWEMSLEGFGFKPEDIWVTVFEGDDELGLGPDEEAIDAWLAIGVPRERIVPCPRSENFWQAGPTGPCGPCSELYLDRGLDWGKPADLPGGENERFLEYWNLVFMQYNQDPVNTLEPLPKQNIDTGLGLKLMAGGYPELHAEAETVDMWLAREEQQFGQTLEQGTRILDEHIARAKEAGEEGIGAEQAFQLHDTYGFPFELTVELAAEQGLGVDAQGFEDLMEEQRTRARASAGRGGRDADRERIRAFADAAGAPTTFTGYERTEQATAIGAVEQEDGRILAKLVESPFYATGGGQVADAGVVECESGDCRALVVDVVRVGDDQALVLEPERGELHEGERVIARVDPAHRRPTACNHTATHLLHAALRERVGGHVRQAGSYVGPDKLRFDFTHSQPLSDGEVRDIEDRVNGWILSDHAVRAITTSLEEAKALGATALFGEKYGDVVRMVEVGDGTWSRELCGGTHVRTTAEIGVFKLTSETSSAANVRRIEAVTGPVAVGLLRAHDPVLGEAAAILRTSPENVAAAMADREAKRRELEKQRKAGASEVTLSADAAVDVDGVRVLVAQADFEDPKAMPDAADRLRSRLGESAGVGARRAPGG